ncbi:hypothetical protein U1Q18_018642 [Sarracenia purpurea var. burkii]
MRHLLRKRLQLRIMETPLQVLRWCLQISPELPCDFRSKPEPPHLFSSNRRLAPRSTNQKPKSSACNLDASLGRFFLIFSAKEISSLCADQTSTSASEIAAVVWDFSLNPTLKPLRKNAAAAPSL